MMGFKTAGAGGVAGVLDVDRLPVLVPAGGGVAKHGNIGMVAVNAAMRADVARAGGDVGRGHFSSKSVNMPRP